MTTSREIAEQAELLWFLSKVPNARQIIAFATRHGEVSQYAATLGKLRTKGWIEPYRDDAQKVPYSGYDITKEGQAMLAKGV